MVVEAGELFSRITAWNLKRNQLEFSLDLETQMLSEEANEFFVSTTFVDKVDAYCDFLFVAAGTIAKAYGCKLGNFSELFYDHLDAVKALEEYISKVRGVMAEVLDGEWKHMFKAHYSMQHKLDDFLEEAMVIVLEANEKKGTEKNAEGKVVKPADFVRPEAKIKELLEDWSGRLV